MPIRALARNPASLSNAEVPEDAVARGDVLDRNSLVTALAGIETVVRVLGAKLTLKPVTLLSEGTRNLVDAMREAGVGRLLCVTGMGAGDSRGHGGFL